MQRRDQREYALLFGKFEVGLKTDKVIHRACGVLLAKLKKRPSPVTCFWVYQSHRLHRAEAQRSLAALSQNLNGHTALIDLWIVHIKIVQRSTLGVDKSVVKNFILLFVQRAVDVVVISAPVIARRRKSVIHVDAFGGNNRRSGVKERQRIAEARFNSLCQSVGSQRPRCNNGNSVVGN